MSQAHTWGTILTLSIAIVAIVVFINPSLANALNTHSVNLERDSLQYFSIADASQTGLDITGDLTIEAWVKLESAPVIDEQYGIASKYGNSSAAYTFFYWNNGGTNQLVFQNSENGVNTRFAAINYTLPVGTWTHVAVSYNASLALIEVFVNGASIGTATGTLTTSIFDSTANFEIGSVIEGEHLFDGLIDEVRVWDILRSATQIANNQMVELDPTSEPNLKGYWKFDAMDGTDATASNNDLTPVNSPGFSTDTPFGTPPFVEDLRAVKVLNENRMSNVLVPDSELTLNLAGGKTYSIEGVLFADATNGTPDLKVSFVSPTGVSIIGYTNAADEEVLIDEQTSARVMVPGNVNRSIHIRGSIVVTSNGSVTIDWSQFTNTPTQVTTLLAGSYLRAEEL